MNKENNFKAMVVKNIGDRSEEIFGKQGTIIQIINGIYVDLYGEDWIFYNYDDLVNTIYEENDRYSTEFELVEDNSSEFNLNQISIGMLIKTTNGDLLVSVGESNKFVNINGFLCSVETSDIDSVYNKTKDVFEFEPSKRTLIWKKPKVVEMTIEEIKELLGIEGTLRIKGYEESWTTTTENGVFPADGKVVEIKYLGTCDGEEYKDLGYRKKDDWNWYWSDNACKISNAVIAWRNIYK